jgi:Fic family protein
LADVEEVSNYVKAINHGLVRLRGGFPLSLMLLREMHAVLLSGRRGCHHSPGAFRKSQNWIGGTRPGNALFVPPPVEHLNACLSDLEKFLHDDSLPLLVKAAISHVQFETIHPFLDGNGRLGRLLIILLLVDGGLLGDPVLYLSLFFKQNRSQYYRLLDDVRANGAWETWIEFFLTGVLDASKQAAQACDDINQLFEEDIEKIATLGRARFSCEQILAYLKKLPQVSVPLLVKALNLSAPTVRGALKHLVALGIIEESSGKRRNKVYTHQKYLVILEDGANPDVRQTG